MFVLAILAGLIGMLFSVLSFLGRLIALPFPYVRNVSAGRKLTGNGQYNEAEKRLRAAFDAARDIAGRDPVLASALADLASGYKNQGHYNEAEWPQTEVVTILENVRGAIIRTLRRPSTI